MERWRALAGRNSVSQPPSPAQVEQGDKEPVFTNTHHLQLPAVAPGVCSYPGVFSTSPICASFSTWKARKDALCKVSSFASSFKETACLCTNPHLLLKDSLNLYEPSELRPAGCGGESFSPIFPICEYFYQSEQQAAVWLLQHLMLIFYVCRLKDHSDTGKYF